MSYESKSRKLNKKTNLTQVNMTVDSTRSYKSPLSIDLLRAGRGRKARTDSDNGSILSNNSRDVNNGKY